MTNQRVLDGVKVLDFTQMLAGPTCTRTMALMGAEIIKIEMAPDGDRSRKIPVLRNGRSAYFIQHNRGKKSLCLDVSHPHATEILHALVSKVDVLVENFSPGVIARRGLDWDTVHQLNPRLVMCSMSAFGREGPLAGKPGFDFIAQAYAGITTLTGEPDGAPGLLGVGAGDIGTGMNAVAAINGALFAAHRAGGRGRYIDVSLLDTYYNMNDTAMEMYSASGGTIVPHRAGQFHFGLAPLGAFATQDGYAVIMALTEGQYASLCETMGQPELAVDPRFHTQSARTDHRLELSHLIEDWTRSFANAAALVAHLDAARVPAGPVLSVAEALELPHAVQRGLVQTVHDPVIGEFKVHGAPFQFVGEDNTVPMLAPTLGQHNEDILTRHLGYSAAQLRELEAAGVLVSGAN